MFVPRRMYQQGKFALLRISVAAVVLSLLMARWSPAAEPPSEYQVKALFLLNFARFVEWPSRAFVDDRDPFVIGVLGADPFGELLDQAIVGQRIAGREIVVRRSGGGKAAPQCHLLFVGGSERRRLGAVLGEIQRAPVLTVSDLEIFTETGGMIEFRKENYKIGFDINVDAATVAELRMSARLLSLAHLVEPRSRMLP